jgi:hypothetical protein
VAGRYEAKIAGGCRARTAAQVDSTSWSRQVTSLKRLGPSSSSVFKVALWFTAVWVYACAAAFTRPGNIEESFMGETRSTGVFLRVAMLFSCAGLLVACAGDPQKPAPVAMGAPPPTIDAPVISGSPRVSSLAPVRRIVAREATQKTPAAAVRSPARHVASSKEHHRSAKARHHKIAKRHVHKRTAQATKASQPKS